MTGNIHPRRHFVGIFLALAASVWMLNAGRQGPALGDRSWAVNEIDARLAKAIIDDGALVIDVRGAQAYAERHVAGAILLPLGDLEAAIPARLAVSKAKPIIVYGADGARSGPEGTAILNKAGFSNAVNLVGGIEGWERAGMPTAKGRG